MIPQTWNCPIALFLAKGFLDAHLLVVLSQEQVCSRFECLLFGFPVPLADSELVDCQDKRALRQ